MPPKNAAKGGGNQAGKKADAKKKEKIIEDKTFGLKNKRGGKQQKFIQQVQKQVIHGGNKPTRQLEKDKEDVKNKKDLKKKELQEINDLFKPVQQQLAKGVDPKSVLCSFFKNGQCSKGNKCKFSHDLSIERKAEKRSAYVDTRSEEKETSENWDEEMLKEVVEQKHGNEAANKPSTQIICRYFLDSVEAGKYGWFWECPNGEKCIYRHALPPGYTLKKDRKRTDRDGEEISLEDLIERERACLGHDTRKVTLETFLAWKKKKLKEKDEKEKMDLDKKKNDYRSGKESGISGREMFIFNPDLAVNQEMDEEGDADFDLRHMEREPPEDGEEEMMDIHYKEIDVSSFMDEYRGDDGGDTTNTSVARPDRFDSVRAEVSKISAVENGLSKEEDGVSECEGAVAIDEDLFEGDDEDLQELEDQLEEMAVTS